MELKLEQKGIRQSHLDVICGILIVYMVFYHCLQCANVTDSIYAKISGRFFFFFMPWFFFKAGMFFKRQLTINALKLGVDRLIRPYIIFSLIGYVFYCAKLFLDGKTDFFSDYISIPLKSILAAGAFHGNAPLWFLLTLFAVRMIYVVLEKKISVCYLLIAGLISMLLNAIGFDKPYWIANVCLGTFFYVSGYLLKESQYQRKMFVMSIVVYMFALIIPSFVDVNRNHLEYGWYLSWMISAIAGCVLFNNLFRAIKSNILFDLFEKIGRNSMVFFCSHWIVLTVTDIFLQMFQIGCWGEKRLIVYFSVALLFICIVLFYKRVTHGGGTK